MTRTTSPPPINKFIFHSLYVYDEVQLVPNKSEKDIGVFFILNKENLYPNTSLVQAHFVPIGLLGGLLTFIKRCSSHITNLPILHNSHRNICKPSHWDLFSWLFQFYDIFVNRFHIINDSKPAQMIAYLRQAYSIFSLLYFF